MVDVSRVQKELTECNRDREVSGVSIALHDGANISHLTGTIAGPADSPYEGGTFVIDIRLPGGYPFEPPKMQFVTKVWYATLLPVVCIVDFAFSLHNVPTHVLGYFLRSGTTSSGR